MDKIYNLQETIYNDKIAIKEIERELAFRKSILSAHESALKRLLSPAEYSPYSKEKVPQSITEKLETPTKEIPPNKERITQENWKDLGIEVGDKVEIVVSGDDDFQDGWVGEVLEIDYHSYFTFLRLRNRHPRDWDWYDYEGNEKDSKIYLIRTEEGSGN